MTDKWVAARAAHSHSDRHEARCARWVAFLGFGLAPFLVFGSWLTRWSILVFPAWVLVVNLYILIDDLRRAPGEDEGNPA